MPKIRCRFAPSPTGYLHIGSLRTVLFNFLFAKSQTGTLILRIEDTDQKRQVEGAQEKLIEIIDWLGLKFDEGPHVGGKYGPYIQSQRREIYDKYKDEIIEKGEAYYCFCTAERLTKMREGQQAKKLPPRYDRECRELSQNEVDKKIKAGESYVIRQKMPLDGEVVVYDELRGEIKFNAKELEDHVLIKSDGMPTYQFANVVDDHTMEITHVIRGEEWIPSFPKNYLLFKSFGWEAPKYIHMPLTLSPGGGKLSKRHGDVAVEEYRAKGYLPEALLNFCVLLGWHTKEDNEIYTIDDLIKKFSLKGMNISPAVFNIEKLDYLNGYWIRKKSLDELLELCRQYLEENIKKTANKDKHSDKFLKNVIRLEQERLKKLSEIGELTDFFFLDRLDYNAELLIWKKLTKEQVRTNLEKVYELLEVIPEENWTDDSLNDALISYIKAKEEKVGDYLWPMRASLTGKKASPGPFEVAEVLGKKESLERIQESVKKLVYSNKTWEGSNG